MNRIGGMRRKSRHKMTKGHRQKGKISLTNYFQTFKEGENVCLAAEPAVQGGFYPAKYLGKQGTIVGKQGRCYQVHINDLGLDKTLIVHPVHLRRR